MMPRVELVHDIACPHVAAARTRLRDALTVAGLPVAWQEWDRAATETPAPLRRYGSPTILVDGRDVAGDSTDLTAAENCCRIYPDADGLQGAPPLDIIINALRTASQ